jgi:polyisoprenoid-binding protein YceI
MSKIISLIVLLVVVVIIVNSMDKKDIKKPVENNGEVTSSTTDKISFGIKKEDGSLEDIKLNNGKYSISPSEITINWIGRKVVLKNWIDKGTINLGSGEFEIKDGKVISNSFVIDMKSIKASATGAGGGQDKLSTHLKSADFFDVEKFASTTFVVKEITMASSTKESYILKGDLTIKDSTNEVSIPVTVDRSKKDMIVANGSIDLDRTLWNVKYGSGKFFDNLGNNVIDDMFNVSFEIKINTSTYKVEAI